VGEIAANAFARFDRGLAPDEVVAELVVSIDTVEHLWRTWARLRGIMLLSPEGARALREALRSNQPINNGADAVAAVRRFVGLPNKPCPMCKNGFRDYCTSCPAREAARATRGARRGVTTKRAP